MKKTEKNKTRREARRYERHEETKDKEENKVLSLGSRVLGFRF